MKKKDETKNTELETVTDSKKEIKKSRSKKEAATIPAKKLPKLLKKSYTLEKLEKKIYKKIYIPEDKKFLESFIKEIGKNKKDKVLYSIPKDTLLSKKDLAKLKLLSKEIKKQKGRIRWIPLIATVAIFTSAVLILSATKNLIAKKAIQEICETAFEAKCDIAYINISLINSDFKMKGFQVANKNEPMKNLFSVESIVFDFNLVELLKSRFVANELSVTGVATNTDRTYSGDISAKLQAKIEKKKAKKAAKEAKKNEDSPFMKALNEKSALAMDTLKSSVNGLFDQYNPETIIKNCYTQLQTPESAKQAEAEIKALIEKWAAKPNEIGTKVSTLSEAAKEITQTNINTLKTDPVKLKAYIESINTVSKQTENLKKDSEKIVNDIRKDVSTVDKTSKKLESSINHDKNLVSSEISKITSFKISDGKRFITGTFDNIAYQLLGKYYPTVKKITNYLVEAKNNKKEKKEKKPSKIVSSVTQRSEGRTVTFKADNTPKLWIKKASGSGPNFSFDAMDITNDMDKTGKPVTGNVKLSFAELDHAAKLVVDTRSNSSAPLILANYNCDKLPFSYPTSKFNDAPGVPGINAVSKLDFTMKIYEDDGFDLTGKGFFRDMEITTIPFEPAFASNIYSNTLANIKSMNLSTTIGYTVSKGINLNLYSDADKQFIDALTKELTNQLSIIKEKAETELIAKLNEMSGGAFGEINNFGDIRAKIDEYINSINKIYDQIEAKRKEAENALNNAVNSAIEDTKNKAVESAKSAASSAVKGLLKQ